MGSVRLGSATFARMFVGHFAVGFASKLRLAAVVLAVAWGTTACASHLQVLDHRGRGRFDLDPGPSVAGRCDPLSSRSRGVELDGALAVARSRDGTYYVVDRVGAMDSRSFRGRDGVLWRQGDVHSGEVSRDRVLYGATVDGSWLRFVVDRAAWLRGTIARREWGMVLVPPEQHRSSEVSQSPPSGERLRQMRESAIRGWRIIDRAPPKIGVQYLARTSDDRWLLITMPEPIGFEHLRLYFGTREAVRERRIVRFRRQRDGGTTRIDFEVDGLEMQAHFPVRCGAPPPPGVWFIRHDCPGELRGAAENVVLARVSPPGAIAELAVVCEPQTVQPDVSAQRLQAHPDARTPGRWPGA